MLGVYQCQEPLYADDDEAADIDFVVALRDPVDVWQETRPLSEIASDIDHEHTVVVLFFPVSESRIERGEWPIAECLRGSVRVA